MTRKREVQPVLTPEDYALLRRYVDTLPMEEASGIRCASGPSSPPTSGVNPNWYGATMTLEDGRLVLIGTEIGRLPLGDVLERRFRAAMIGDPCDGGYLVDLRMPDRTILELIAVYPDGSQQTIWKIG